MIHKIFGSNNTLALYLIPFFGVGLILLAYLSGASQISTALPNELLGIYIENLLNYEWLQATCNLVFVVLGAWLATTLSTKQEIYERPNHWPAIIYILVCTSHPSYLAWNGFVPANLFTLLALRKIIAIYNVPNANHSIFDAGLLIALAGYFQVHYWFIILIPIAAISIMRPFKWREYIILLLGFVTPFYFHQIILFWNDQPLGLTFLSELFHFSWLNLFTFESRLNHITWFVILSLAIFLLLSSMRYSKVQQRKHKQILLFLAINFSLIALLFTGSFWNQIHGWMAIPMALVTPFFIQWIKKSWMQNGLILYLFALLICNYLLFPSVSQ